VKIKDQQALIEEARNAPDQRAKVRIGFPDAFILKKCSKCHGQGSTMCGKCDAVEADPCFWCEGTGRQTYLGKSKSKCKRCLGLGKYPCSTCSNTFMTACSTCQGTKAIMSELGCIIEMKIIELPAVTTLPINSKEEKTSLVESIAEKIRSIYFTASSDCLPKTEGYPPTPLSNTPTRLSATKWYPIEAICHLDTYSSSTVTVSKTQAQHSKKTWKSLKRGKTSTLNRICEEKHYIVPSNSRYPIRKYDLPSSNSLSSLL